MLIPEQGKVGIKMGRPMKGIKGHNEQLGKSSSRARKHTEGADRMQRVGECRFQVCKGRVGKGRELRVIHTRHRVLQGSYILFSVLFQTKSSLVWKSYTQKLRTIFQTNSSLVWKEKN